MMMIFVLVFNRKLLRCVVSPQVNSRQSWILDSTLWDLDSRYWILDSLSVRLGFRIPIISGIRDSRFQSLEGFRILWAGFLRVVTSSQETKWQLTYISSTEEYQFMLPMFDFWRYCPGSGCKCGCSAYLRAALIYVLFVMRFATLCKEMHEMLTRPW